ncbi:MAG TPA: acyl-CoA-binding protein [Flavipsychrobacter sp.]|nr:acyl-CoA-binding protein [Flavipsychrobacter sp.]
MMEKIVYEAKVTWSQLDPNMHLRHSAYSDFATQGRLELMQQMNLGVDELLKQKIGPVLFKEEIQYLKEVLPNDTVKVTCSLKECREDGSRWTFVQKLFTDEDKLAAVIQVQGAWIDLGKRKITKLPDAYLVAFLHIERTPDFRLLPHKNTTDTMNVSDAFNDAVTRSKQLTERPDNDILLQLYALYKQATVGDAAEKGDYGMFDFKEKFKHEAWLKLRSMTSEDAQKQYIDLVNKLAG